MDLGWTGPVAMSVDKGPNWIFKKCTIIHIESWSTFTLERVELPIKHQDVIADFGFEFLGDLLGSRFGISYIQVPYPLGTKS